MLTLQAIPGQHGPWSRTLSRSFEKSGSSPSKTKHQIWRREPLSEIRNSIWINWSGGLSRKASRYGLGGPEIESRWGGVQDFPQPCRPALGAHTTSYTIGTGSLSREQSGRSMALTHPPPTSSPFVACSRMTLTFISNRTADITTQQHLPHWNKIWITLTLKKVQEMISYVWIRF